MGMSRPGESTERTRGHDPWAAPRPGAADAERSADQQVGSGWISIRSARRVVLECSRPLSRSERIPVTEATGRRLAEVVRLASDLPPFDRVTMDGYAVRAADVRDAPVVLPVVGEVAAGARGDEPLEAGQAQAIMTGAPLPPGADAVVQVEWTRRLADGVQVERSVVAGQNVVPQGQSKRAGDRLAEVGDVVGPMGLSLLVSSGAGEVLVRARPTVAVLTSGDELLPPGTPLERGQIHESNGPALAELFRSCGAEVRALGVARDTREALTEMVEQALECDVVVLTGGSSVGRYDFSAEVVASFGTTRHFDRLSVKPGKPTIFDTRGASLVFCLPGNPVAALMTGRLLVCAAVRRLAGDAVADWSEQALPLATAIQRHPKRDLVIPVQLRGGALQFDGWHGSGDLACMARADAFAYLPMGEGEAPSGTLADVFRLPGSPAW